MFNNDFCKKVLALASLPMGLPLLASCEITTSISGTETFEKIPEGESSTIAHIATLTTDLQDKRRDLPEQNGKVFRGVHPKSHGCVVAEFIVNNDIAEEYQVGLFSTPGKSFASQIRFSNASVKLAPDLEDGKNGSRGMAIKVFDVEGDFLETDNGKQNQDFLMINTPEFAFADVRGYGFLTDALHASPHGNDAISLLSLVAVLAQANRTPPPFPVPTQQDLDKLNQIVASQGGALPEGFSLEDLKQLTATLNVVVTKIQTQPVRNPLEVQYFGAAPFLFGPDSVMKFSAAPVKRVEQAPFSDTDQPSKDYLREALTKAMIGKEGVVFDFRILVRDKSADFGPDQVLIENATTTWDENGKNEVDTYVNVAKVIVKSPQDINSEQAQAQCESLAFTPWHSLSAHQPVGGINRLRQSVYTRSASHRKADQN
jgi:hypothetical protein